jgi:sialidase-1
MIHVRHLVGSARLMLLSLSFSCLTFTDKVGGAEGPQGLAAFATSPVHPLLIRNEHGPLLRVVVEAADPKDVFVNEVSFNLDGTDDLNDLESLTLFATGDKLDFSSRLQIGEPIKPAGKATFRVKQALSAGQNVFWLSCQLKATADLSHRVAGVCTSLETTLGALVPRDATPGVRHRIGVAIRRHKDDGVHTYRIPALATSAKGTLLCVYDMRRRMGRDLQEDIDIGLSRSTDGGRSWNPVRVIMDMGEYGGLPQEQNGCSDPGIIVDRQTGEIFCFAVWMNGKPGKHQWTGDGSESGYEIGKSAQFLVVRSQDDGLTWSKPENLTRKLKQEAWWLFAPSPQQGIQLADGMLVMPSQGRDEKGKEFSTIMVSRDHGANWTVATPAYSGGSECQVAQLGDGSLMLNMRNEHERFRAVFTTRDFGRTWEPHPTNRNAIMEPNCNGSLLRVDYEAAGEKKHVLLFANPHTQKGRTHHTIQVSWDDGRTWPRSHHLLLDEGLGAGYPSLTRVDDQHVGIVYEGSQSHLVFERLSLDELLRR